LRKKGSFKESLRAFNLLQASKIASACMFSLSKLNANELKEVMTLAADYKIDVFSFARVVPFGQMKKEEIFSPLEYRDFLTETYTHQLRLTASGTLTRFTFKDHLWKLFFYERKEYQVMENTDQILDGCGMGINNLSVLADGTVYACRRFISPVGKLPQQSIAQIFLGKKLNEYRRVEKLEKCSRCKLLNYCRGCPAVAWGTNGSYKRADPQCWKLL
jgi:radical SAM protein with 4Fe4S-binding SPASM domain